uniref:Uncharacterized protein n=1 Tax=Mus musculus TaxID=10090 RepID=Q8C4I9_MOUSE|nr:unnamed protein product [Mus musculus]
MSAVVFTGLEAPSGCLHTSEDECTRGIGVVSKLGGKGWGVSVTRKSIKFRGSTKKLLLRTYFGPCWFPGIFRTQERPFTIPALPFLMSHSPSVLPSPAPHRQTWVHMSYRPRISAALHALGDCLTLLLPLGVSGGFVEFPADLVQPQTKLGVQPSGPLYL